MDFADARIEEIPEEAFMNSGVFSVILSDSVKILGAHCFSGAPLYSINTDCVERFMDHCLDTYIGGYIYLSDAAEYVGNMAISSTNIYIYADHKPSAWAERISDDQTMSQRMTFSVRATRDYLYTEVIGEATICAYRGDDSAVEIPNKINDMRVTAIGKGFGSLSAAAGEFFSEGGELPFSLPRLYRIPTGVKLIEHYCFEDSGAMILIPSTVKKAWIDTDENGDAPFYAFESESYPSLTYGKISGGAYYDGDNVMAEKRHQVRACLGVNTDRIVLDEDACIFYEEDADGYTLLAVMDYTLSELDISGEYNGKCIHTLGADSISALPDLRIVRVLGGVNKIKSYALDCLSLDLLFVGDSVTVAESYSMESVTEKYLLGAESVPAGWDELWLGLSIWVDIEYGVDPEAV